MNDELKQLISAYYDNALTLEEKAQAENLLAIDSQAQAYLKELQKISSSLKTVGNESFSKDAELKLLSNITKERPMKTSTFKTTATVLASLMICVLVFNNYQKYTDKTVPAKVLNNTVYTTIIPQGKHSGNQIIVDQYSEMKAVSVPVQEKTSRQNSSNAFYTEGGASLGSVQYEPTTMLAGGSPAQEAYTQVTVNRVRKSGGVNSLAAPQRAGMAYDSVYEPSIMPYYPPYYQQAPSNTAEYNQIVDNKFLMVTENPLSTFSIDVDTASYSNIRRFLNSNQMPPKDAVRIEEMINYFRYDYPEPKEGEAFSVTTDLATTPWANNHQLLRVGLKGKIPQAKNVPPSNLTFLIDTSGSMQPADRLPLIKEGFKMLVRQLRPQDKVAIVVYAGAAGTVLEPTSGDQKDRIIEAIDRLGAGGSTAGGAGIQLAYQLAKNSFIKEGNNRVILATDGDFNVGVSSTSELTNMIEERRKDGIFLTVLGVGNDNLKDGRMESIADKGNGNYYYIDSMKEAKKVMVDELGSTIYTIAKDVKIQIEFNPALVKAYRLIGYENRMLAKEDFNNDKKDAGEIGAGHTVTALYEIVPASSTETFDNVDALKYQKPAAAVTNSNELLTVKLRYKEPDGDTSKLISKTVNPSELKAEPTGDFAWASSVAEFGMLLRNSEHKGSSSYDHVLKTARANMGEDKFSLRQEFINLVESASHIAPTQEGQINFK